MFRKTKKRVNKPLHFPNGMMLKTEQGYFYIKAGKRLRLISDRAAMSWGLHVILCDESAVPLKISGTLGFRPGSVLKDYGSGKRYLLETSGLKLITDPDLLGSIGSPPVIEVSPNEIKYHEGKVSK